jgi:outer membrane protein assembly factor BamB
MGNIIIPRKIFSDQHGMACLYAAHRADGAHIWITAANILNT